jgi:hypothetical protein
LSLFFQPGDLAFQQVNLRLNIFCSDAEKGVLVHAFVKDIKSIGFSWRLQQPINRAFSILGNVPFGEKIPFDEFPEITPQDCDDLLGLRFRK